MDYVTWIIIAIVVLIIISIIFTIPCMLKGEKESLAISDARADALIRAFRANIARSGTVLDFMRVNGDIPPYAYAQMLTLYNSGKLTRANVHQLFK